jgi:hypothetical protein
MPVEHQCPSCNQPYLYEPNERPLGRFLRCQTGIDAAPAWVVLAITAPPASSQRGTPA